MLKMTAVVPLKHVLDHQKRLYIAFPVTPEEPAFTERLRMLGQQQQEHMHNHR